VRADGRRAEDGCGGLRSLFPSVHRVTVHFGEGVGWRKLRATRLVYYCTALGVIHGTTHTVFCHRRPVEGGVGVECPLNSHN
jgi:hypothetical protein